MVVIYLTVTLINNHMTGNLNNTVNKHTQLCIKTNMVRAHGQGKICLLIYYYLCMVSKLSPWMN